MIFFKKSRLAIPLMLSVLSFSPAAQASDGGYGAALMEAHSGPITVSMAESLLQKYPEIGTSRRQDSQPRSAINALLNACAMSLIGPCEPAVVDYLVSKGADVNDVDQDTGASILETNLQYAGMYHGDTATKTPGVVSAMPNPKTSRDEYLALVKAFVAAGAKPVQPEMPSWYALYMASDLGADFVNVLMAAGADPAPARAQAEADLKSLREIKALLDSAVAP